MKGVRKICVAFDLDDTLFKERDYVKTGWRAVAEAYAHVTDKTADELYALMSSTPDAFDALLALPAIRRANLQIADFLTVYRAHRPTLTLPSDTETALRQLTEKGVAVAIITDGRTLTQRNKIEALGLDKLIPPENILISEEVGSDKLTPGPFECLMRRQLADRYYMVGDNPIKDFYHPNLLGWTSVMLRDRAGINVPSQSLDDKEPDYWPQIFIDNLTQLTELCLPL